MRPEDLEKIAICYDKIRTVYRSKKHSVSDKQMATDFGSHMEKVMQQLNVCFDEDKHAINKVHAKNYSIISAKYQLLDVCWEKALLFLDENSSEIKPAFEQIRSYIGMIVADL